jgi:hypothetical protein
LEREGRGLNVRQLQDNPTLGGIIQMRGNKVKVLKRREVRGTRIETRRFR